MNLAGQLRRQGLFLRGVTRLSAAELDRFALAATRPLLALVGNIGSSYWPQFSRADEFRDGAADPLDRWSRRIAQTLADEFSLQPLYPFDGPPYYPFQQWAQRAEGLQSSPLGILMHPEFGLWHSYRFAFLGAEFASTQTSAPQSPCSACSAKPCLERCPVNAFDAGGYAVERCADYLRDNPQAACHQQGCLARNACPVAPDLRYVPAQGQFHLRAFLDARN